MRWKFWDKSQEDESEVPEDLQYWRQRQNVYSPSNVQQGHVPAGPGLKSVVVAASFFAIAVVGIFLWLYFHQFLFSNDT